MSFKVEGLDLVKFMISQGGEKAIKGAIDHMRVEANAMAELARRQAPVDEGNLEDAIIVRDDGGGRDNAGRFQRKTVVVEVDNNKTVVDSSGRAKLVGDYAWVMHEHLTPASNEYQLGKLSLAKQAANPDVIVGGKFLERAVEEVSKGLMDRMAAAIAKTLT